MQIGDYLDMDFLSIFEKVLEYLIVNHDTSKDYGLLRKFEYMLEYLYYKLAPNEYSLWDLEDVKEDNNELYKILLNLTFDYHFPSILKYYYDNYSKFEDLISIDNLDELYYNIVHLFSEEYLIQPDGLNEDVIIDILKLYIFDKKLDNLEDLIVSNEAFEELENAGYNKLMKFLMENDVIVE